jgi:hypothetical protein
MELAALEPPISGSFSTAFAEARNGSSILATGERSFSIFYIGATGLDLSIFGVSFD